MTRPTPTSNQDRAPALTVLLCSHNPRDDYMQETLHSLEAQSLPKDQWELLLIDNASGRSLSDAFPLPWHPEARHMRVDRLGKTHAIVRGIKDGRGDLLVTVDDDNVLDSDYLETLLRIFGEHANLGVVSGKIEARFESGVEAWAETYVSFLALRDLGNRPRFSVARGIHPWTPVGAGMGCRRQVAEFYVEQVARDPIRHGSHPGGISIGRAQDTDMALCGPDLGCSAGYFPQLHLTHLIDSNRLSADYLERLIELSMYEATLCVLIRGLYRPRPPWRRWLSRGAQALGFDGGTRSLRYRMRCAIDRGKAKAVRDYARLSEPPAGHP